MFGRGIFLPIALAVAFFVPYFLSQNNEPSSGIWDQVFGNFFQDDRHGDAVPISPTVGEFPNDDVSSVLPPPIQALVEEEEFRPNGPVVQSPVQLFRFDITTAHILSSWSRVTANLWEDGFEGMRVAVVSGTNPQDVVGSLTYYFDQQQVLQRIRFQGYTGDHTHLLAGLVQAYKLKSEPHLGGGLYVTRWNKQPTIVVRIQHGTVVRFENALQRMRIDLELNRPGKTAALSEQFMKMVELDPPDIGDPPAV